MMDAATTSCMMLKSQKQNVYPSFLPSISKKDNINLNQQSPDNFMETFGWESYCPLLIFHFYLQFCFYSIEVLQENMLTLETIILPSDNYNEPSIHLFSIISSSMKNQYLTHLSPILQLSQMIAGLRLFLCGFLIMSRTI